MAECYAHQNREVWLPLQEQQQAISAGLAGFVQPEPSQELGQGEEPNGGDDEYDPEDADMQLF